MDRKFCITKDEARKLLPALLVLEDVSIFLRSDIVLLRERLEQWLEEQYSEVTE